MNRIEEWEAAQQRDSEQLATEAKMRITREQWLEFQQTLKWDDAYEHAKRLLKLIDEVAFTPPECRGLNLRRMAAEVQDIAVALRLGEDGNVEGRTKTPEVAPRDDGGDPGDEQVSP